MKHVQTYSTDVLLMILVCKYDMKYKCIYIITDHFKNWDIQWISQYILSFEPLDINIKIQVI